MSQAVRYVTYGVAVAILLTFVYVAIEQTVQDHRQAKRERAHPGYLPDDTFWDIVEREWPEQRKARR